MVCIGESHIRGAAALSKTRKAFSDAGWVANIAEAAQSVTSAEGTYGGAICAVRAHLARKPLLADLGPSYEVTGKSSTLDLAGWGIGVPSADILVYAGYCRHGEVAGTSQGSQPTRARGLARSSGSQTSI